MFALVETVQERNRAYKTITRVLIENRTVYFITVCVNDNNVVIVVFSSTRT